MFRSGTPTVEQPKTAPMPIRLRVIDGSLKRLQRLCGSFADDLKALDRPRAARDLEDAQHMILNAREHLVG